MRISRIDLHEVHVPDRPWAWSDEVFGMPAHRREPVVILVVRTDEGLEGLGEVNLRFDLGLITSEVTGWLGLDPLRLNLAELTAPGSTRVSERLRYAFECAVLDIRGKALGCPVSELLGGRLRERVPVALCTGYKTAENTAQDAAWGWEHGFRTYKTLCVDRRRGQGRARPRPTVSLSPFPSSVEGRKARARGRHKE
ncbi:MAG: mandelate racemase/muconate lactonizing enzyme family protein, partial [Candidatus Latescibacterota bacterium]